MWNRTSYEDNRVKHPPMVKHIDVFNGLSNPHILVKFIMRIYIHIAGEVMPGLWSNLVSYLVFGLYQGHIKGEWPSHFYIIYAAVSVNVNGEFNQGTSIFSLPSMISIKIFVVALNWS